MFEDKNIQYVSIKQHDKQLKIDNKVVNNGKTIKTNHSSFLVDDTLSSDAISKLNILQKDYNKTYLATLCDSKTQKIVEVDSLDDDSYEVRKLNSKFSIAIEKYDLDQKQNYFNSTGIDYIFSPFTILYKHLMSIGANTNSLNIIILNNTIYAFIFDKDKKIVFNTIKSLTAFDDIQDSQFYEDKLDGQKLFDEIHYLEIQETISAITNEFYENSDNEIFCESVSLFYTVKQLNEEQVNNLHNTLMLEIEYSLIQVDKYIFSLIKQQHKMKSSFIKPREKKEKKTFLLFFIAALISTVLVAGIFLYIQNKNEQELKHKAQVKADKIALAAKRKAKALAIRNSIKLPNHQIKNNEISNFLLSIFNIIPYNAVLSELQVNKKDSTFVCNFLGKDTFTKDIQPKLLKFYKSSEVLLMQNKKNVYNVIISNTKKLVKKSTIKDIVYKYPKTKFLSKKLVIRKIRKLLSKQTRIKFISQRSSKFTVYTFAIKTIFQTPKELFSFIEKLNQQQISIYIEYPIEFAKTKKGLETNFTIKVNQLNKIAKSLNAHTKTK